MAKKIIRDFIVCVQDCHLIDKIVKSGILRIWYKDDQILMATSEDDLQSMAHHLNLIARKYKMTISSTNKKSMAMWGNHIQGVKIVINDNIIEQVTVQIPGVPYIRIQK